MLPDNTHGLVTVAGTSREPPLTGEDAVWLSNLDEDPGESRNLRKLHPNVADELATLAAKWMVTLPSQQENK